MAISDDMTKHVLHSSFTRSESDINPSKYIALDKGVKTAMQRLAEGITTSQDTSAHGLPWLRCFVQSSGQANVLGEGIVEFGSFLQWGGGMVAAGTSGSCTRQFDCGTRATYSCSHTTAQLCLGSSCCK